MVDLNKESLQEVFGHEITIELTDRCNLRCGYCNQKFSPNYPHLRFPTGDINFNLFKSIIDSICNKESVLYKNNKVILHWMGESVLHPRFLDILDYTAKKFKTTNHRLELHTNAINLNKEIIKGILNAPFLRIQFTLDAINRATYKAIKGFDSLKKAMQNVQEFFIMRKGIQPMAVLQFIVVPEILKLEGIGEIKYTKKSNAGEISQFVKFWDKFLKEQNILDKQYDDIIFIRTLDTTPELSQLSIDFYKKAVLKSGIKPKQERHVKIVTPPDNNWNKPFKEMVRDLK